MTLIFFLKCLKFNVDCKNAIKKLQNVFFSQIAAFDSVDVNHGNFPYLQPMCLKAVPKSQV